MSTLVENVAKVTAAHAALKEAIAAKGVSVPEGTKLTDMPALVDRIETREPEYQAVWFSFNGQYQGEDVSGIQTLDATKPITIDPTTLSSYKYMFNGCPAKRIIIPQLSMADDYSYMFENAALLESIEFPDGFGQYAIDVSSMFRGCTSLSSLELPENFASSTTKTPSYFLNGCSSLKRLKFGKGCFNSLKSISASIIGGCTSLMTVEFDAGAMENMETMSLFNNGTGGLTHIGDSVIGSIVMPEGFGKHITKFIVTKIQATELRFPDSMGSLATSWTWDDLTGMVRQCPELTYIRLPQGRNFDTDRVYSTECAFTSCHKLRRVELPAAPYFARCRIDDYVTMWKGCDAVEEIVGALDIGVRMNTYATKYRVDISHMQSLTHDSLMVFVNGLQSITNPVEGSTFTFLMGSTNLAKLTDEEKKVATDKGWTLA